MTVAGGERAFSKLKLIKIYLRSTMSQDRLCSLAMLSIESQLARKLDFKDLISDFACKKARRWAEQGLVITVKGQGYGNDIGSLHTRDVHLHH